LPRPRLPNFLNLVGTELDAGSAGNIVCLFCAANANDRPRDSRILQGPSDRHLARGCIVSFARGTQSFDQLQIAGEQWLLEIRALLPPVVFGQSRDPLASHRAAQQTRSHRGVDNDANPMIQGERKNGRLSASVATREYCGCSEAMGHIEGTFHLLRIEIRDADVADLALCLEFRQLTNRLFDRSRL